MQPAETKRKVSVQRRRNLGKGDERSTVDVQTPVVANVICLKSKALEAYKKATGSRRRDAALTFTLPKARGDIEVREDVSRGINPAAPPPCTCTIDRTEVYEAAESPSRPCSLLILTGVHLHKR